MKNRLFFRLSLVITALFILFAGPSARAQFSTVAYEGFNYSSGNLSGQSGGTGWSSAWINDYGSGTTLTVSSNGLTYSGLTTTGGSAAWQSGGNGIAEDSRTLPLQNSGIVYLELLGQFGSSSGGGTPNVRLFNSASLSGGVGGNGGTHGAYVSILDNTLNPATDGSSSSSVPLSNLNLIVLRIDYQTDQTGLWLNPNLSTFDYQNPTTPNATYAGLAPAFNTVSLVTRSPGTFDEITVRAEPAPEPESVALCLLGLGAIAYVRCKPPTRQP